MFSPERAARVAGFFEKVLVHSAGEWAGQPFTLMDWQRRDVINPVFGTLNEDGTRQYRIAFLDIPKKNGKSGMSSGVGLYLLTAENEPAGEIYSAAAEREQADQVGRVARFMAEGSPALKSRLKIYEARKRIVDPVTKSFYQVISAEAYSKHGFNISGILFDEIHTQPNDDLYNTLHKGTAARRQPLTFITTTAGNRSLSLWGTLRRYAMGLLKLRHPEQYTQFEEYPTAVQDDPTFFAYVRAAPKAADWTDEAVWRACNPSLGVTVKLDFLRAECERAQQVPEWENSFRQLHLNQEVSQSVRWLRMRDWDATAGEADAHQLLGRSCYAGLDLSSTTDITALILDFPLESGIHKWLCHFWLPEDNVDELAKRDKVPYRLWIKQGYITTTPGNCIDYDYILEEVKRLNEVYRILEVAYDRWSALQLALKLQDSGLKVIPFGQGYKDMSPATKALEVAVLEKRLNHGGNPVLHWMADNMVVTKDAAGNIKPDKEKATQKIDGMVAGIMGLDRAERREDVTGESIYNTKEMVIL